MYVCMYYTCIFQAQVSEIHRKQSNHLEKKEEAMLPYGNGFRGSINPTRIYRCKRASAFLIDETMLQISSSNEAWLWVAIEPIQFTGKFLEFIYISRHRIMMIAERGIYFSIH
jgi:hypothetical protein